MSFYACYKTFVLICSILDYTHLEKQLALLRTALTDTSVPPQTWLPFFWRLAIHGHLPAVAELPLKIRELNGALPQKTCWLAVAGTWVAGETVNVSNEWMRAGTKAA